MELTRSQAKRAKLSFSYDALMTSSDSWAILFKSSRVEGGLSSECWDCAAGVRVIRRGDDVPGSSAGGSSTFVTACASATGLAMEFRVST